MFQITHENASALFRQYANAVYRIALGIVRSPEEAEDILMDCFSAAIHHAGGFNDENHLKNWLMRMAEHRALNVVKSARVKRNVPLEAAEEVAAPQKAQPADEIITPADRTALSRMRLIFIALFLSVRSSVGCVDLH